MKNWMVSPRYDMRSLRDGRVTPVDVFEDAIQGWILDYVAALTERKEDAAGMAVMILVAAYPETIECYLTGSDSRNASRRFFTSGMRRVFPEVAEVPDVVLNAVCDDLRNGLYHGSMLRGGVVLVPDGPAVMYKADESLFTINPFAFAERVQTHFNEYVQRLRAAGPEDVGVINFHRFWETRHNTTVEAVAFDNQAAPRAGEIAVSTAAPMDTKRYLRNLE